MSADPPRRDGPQLLPELIASAPVAAAILDRELRYRWVNQALCRLNGRTADEHLGRRPRDILGPLGEELESLLSGVVSGGEPIVNHRFTGRRPNAGGHWMGSYHPIRNSSGDVIAVGAMVTDVTEQERGIASEREFLVALVRVAQAVATQADASDTLNVVAREAAGVLGLEGAVVVCFRADGVALEGRWGSVVEIGEVGAVLPSSTTPLTEMVRRTGRPRRMQTDDPDALGFRSRVAAPITVGGALWGAVKAGSPQRRELPADAEARLARFAELVALAISNAGEQRRLIEEARRDPLTGLCNRRSFQERLESEAQRSLRHAGGFSLVLLDIDEFKQINDTHGHDIGDAVLVETARRLSQEVRAVDVLARVGGEEFAWILPDVSGGDALLAAERARQLIAADPFPAAGRITICAGVASFDEAGGTEILFQQADRALYEAKHRGRNRSVRHRELAHSVAGTDTERAQARAAEQSHALGALRALARAIDAKDPLPSSTPSV